MTTHVKPPDMPFLAEGRPRPGRRVVGRPPPGGGRGWTAAETSLRRRRLLLVSAPFVALLALLGLRLVTLNAVHDRTLAAYHAGDRGATLAWGERQGWVNTVERFRAPFAIGDAHVLAGRFDLARTAFEQALADVPDGGLDECKIRVNLGLTYERLGDDARVRERPAEAKQFYDKGIRVTRERPMVCDAPERGEGTGQRLREVQERMEQKSGTPDGQPPEAPEPEAGPQIPQAQPTPDPLNTPSEEQQRELERKQRENTVERNRRLGTQDQGEPGGGVSAYPKPW